MLDKIRKLLLSNKYAIIVIDAPLKIKLPVFIIALGLFLFIFYGILVSPVISQANQRENHINSMES